MTSTPAISKIGRLDVDPVTSTPAISKIGDLTSIGSVKAHRTGTLRSMLAVDSLRHPALWTGSCFQDLVGARLLDGFDPSGLLDELPRFRLREAYEVVGLPAVKLAPATNEALGRVGASRLVELAAGVFAVGPEMRGAGRSKRVLEARILAAHAGRLGGLTPAETARFLGVEARAVRRLAKRPLPQRAMLALRTRLALEERAQRSLVLTSTRAISKTA